MREVVVNFPSGEPLDIHNYSTLTSLTNEALKSGNHIKVGQAEVSKPFYDDRNLKSIIEQSGLVPELATGFYVKSMTPEYDGMLSYGNSTNCGGPLIASACNYIVEFYRTKSI